MSIPIKENRLENLTKDEISRYSRHLILPNVGIEGQKKLKAAKVLIVGIGGLGSPLALYLAAAGIGTIGLVDFDNVDFSNLQRQIIHTTEDIDRPKTASAQDKIKSINPNVKVNVYNTMLKSDNALEILKSYDIVADGSDNFQTRYLVNDACVLLGIPNVYGSIFQFEGQAGVFWADKGSCYRCLQPEPPPPGLVPSCAESGVMGVLPGIIGTIQACEIIKLITGIGEPLIGRLLTFDAMSMRFRTLEIEKNEHCPICGKNPTINKLLDYEEFCGLKRNEEENPVEALSAEELKRRIDNNEPLQIVDIRQPREQAIYKFPNALVIPYWQLYSRKDELAPDIDTVILCKIGQRSIFAIKTLEEAGFKGKLFNLKGGVNAWTKAFVPDAAQY